MELKNLSQAKVKIQALTRPLMRFSAHPVIRVLIRVALSYSRVPPAEIEKIDDYLQSYQQSGNSQNRRPHKDSNDRQAEDKPSLKTSLDEAAEQGDADAQYRLGVCYAEGEGVSQNKKEAIYWYRQAAEQGFAVAQLALGTSYLTGDGVPKNEQTAYMWFLLAKANGDAEIKRVVGEAIDLLESLLSRAERAAAQEEAQMQERMSKIQAGIEKDK
ncbi:MAG: tetratricopeptide repeat protein [Alphaproteobacteria bacterium]|nr:tetratricopeptide repeat protein [Alphaproteobacteria bacterium]